MTTIIDYDAGNIKSVENALRLLGEEVRITRDAEEIKNASRVVLPGVGAFGDAMEKLTAYGLCDAIRETVSHGTPFLGICLGMQLLFESSEESPGVRGLSLLRGRIRRFPEKEDLKIPHIGWNDLRFPVRKRLFRDIPQSSYVYFVHSYFLHADDPSIVSAQTLYGLMFDAGIEKENLFACQFHPEKSADVGMQILKNFLEV